MMPRSSSAEPAKSSKRKGTRSVSTLTPSQLARKRANDREAQRAIRARTKEHIERLERELDEFRCNQSRDKTVQELLRRNRALEDEVRRLKDSNSITSSPYSAPAVYDDNLSVASTMPSPQMSPLPSGPDYASLPEYPQQQYVSLPKNCESWASSVGSPCSSVNDADYSSTPAYIPTSMPASMMHGTNMGSAKDVKMEFEDMHSMAAQNYMHQQHQSPHQQHQQRPQAWNMYPMYYEAASPSPCVSR
ncbi:bZIP transcription factor [Hirsutella rhossiliensis]|uniref:BZIP transcription factor n=1 Tax=Hirsutella rhossiliensis TaxID=111463 RepID=A0A9P8N605_9HYPO|nr:bZIP transcription factor [Hirsutella rhossiliensis]KAH0967404.1 bZIP transcription factor [Hirsutella rhossiliensis]